MVWPLWDTGWGTEAAVPLTPSKCRMPRQRCSGSPVQPLSAVSEELLAFVPHFKARRTKVKEKKKKRKKKEKKEKKGREKRKEKERKGKERKGKERKGKERKGKERKGKERKGKGNEK
jgi:hypothetical protein